MTAVENAIAQYPFSGIFLTKKAGLFIIRKKFVEAEKLLEAAEAMMPNEMSIYLLRSDIFLGRHEYVKAIEVLTRLLP